MYILYRKELPRNEELNVKDGINEFEEIVEEEYETRRIEQKERHESGVETAEEMDKTVTECNIETSERAKEETEKQENLGGNEAKEFQEDEDSNRVKVTKLGLNTSTDACELEKAMETAELMRNVEYEDVLTAINGKMYEISTEKELLEGNMNLTDRENKTGFEPELGIAANIAEISEDHDNYVNENDSCEIEKMAKGVDQEFDGNNACEESEGETKNNERQEAKATVKVENVAEFAEDEETGDKLEEGKKDEMKLTDQEGKSSGADGLLNSNSAISSEVTEECHEEVDDECDEVDGLNRVDVEIEALDKAYIKEACTVDKEENLVDVNENENGKSMDEEMNSCVQKEVKSNTSAVEQEQIQVPETEEDDTVVIKGEERNMREKNVGDRGEHGFVQKDLRGGEEQIENEKTKLEEALDVRGIQEGQEMDPKKEAAEFHPEETEKERIDSEEVRKKEKFGTNEKAETKEAQFEDVARALDEVKFEESQLEEIFERKETYHEETEQTLEEVAFGEVQLEMMSIERELVGLEKSFVEEPVQAREEVGVREAHLGEMTEKKPEADVANKLEAKCEE